MNISFNAKAIRKELTKLEMQLSASQRNAHVGSWELHLGETGNSQVFWSDETFRIFGFEPNEVPATRELFYELAHPSMLLSTA
jgi:hypothetical protein